MKIRKNYLFIVLVILTALSLSACSKRSTGSGIVQSRMGTGVPKDEAVEQIQQEETSAEDAGTDLSDLFIVTKIDTESKQVSFQKVSSGRQSQYPYDTGTRFLDKYDNTKAAVSFLPGDVVEIELTDNASRLVRVQMSDEVWIHDDIKNYFVDEEINAITIGQTKYSYDSGMDIFSGEAKIGFASVGSNDVLRAVGIGKKLISLAVTKGHGYLALANTKLFEGSFICVGDRIFEEVSKNMQMEVPEGKYLVTVANNGYGGSREIVIERDQTTSLNLDELKGEGPKICKAVFDVGVDGAVLFIDGKKADYSAPIELSYGVHTIAVGAEGYDTIERKLVVNSESAEIEIALTASSEKEDETKTNDNSANDNSNQNNSQNNTGNNNNDTNSNANTNNNVNNNTNGTNGTQNDTSQTDYLTTLYNLLTSINNTNNNNTNNNTNSTTDNTNTGNNSNSGDSYDDLRDQ